MKKGNGISGKTIEELQQMEVDRMNDYDKRNAPKVAQNLSDAVVVSGSLLDDIVSRSRNDLSGLVLNVLIEVESNDSKLCALDKFKAYFDLDKSLPADLKDNIANVGALSRTEKIRALLTDLQKYKSIEEISSELFLQNPRIIDCSTETLEDIKAYVILLKGISEPYDKSKYQTLATIPGLLVKASLVAGGVGLLAMAFPVIAPAAVSAIASMLVLVAIAGLIIAGLGKAAINTSQENIYHSWLKDFDKSDVAETTVIEEKMIVFIKDNGHLPSSIKECDTLVGNIEKGLAPIAGKHAPVKSGAAGSQPSVRHLVGDQQADAGESRENNNDIKPS